MLPPATRNADRYWYERAEASIRKVGGEHYDMLARLIATLSPQTSVEQNVGWAVQALRQYRDEGRAPAFGYLHVGRFAGVRERVNVVLNGGEVTGQKCSQFYRGLVGDGEAVAIDNFVALAIGADPRALTPHLYQRLAADIRHVAHDWGWQPRQLQAALWAVAPRQRPGGDLGKALEQAEGLLYQGKLWVGGPYGQRRGNE